MASSSSSPPPLPTQICVPNTKGANTIKYAGYQFVRLKPFSNGVRLLPARTFVVPDFTIKDKNEPNRSRSNHKEPRIIYCQLCLFRKSLRFIPQAVLELLFLFDSRSHQSTISTSLNPDISKLLVFLAQASKLLIASSKSN